LGNGNQGGSNLFSQNQRTSSGFDDSSRNQNGFGNYPPPPGPTGNRGGNIARENSLWNDDIMMQRNNRSNNGNGGNQGNRSDSPYDSYDLTYRHNTNNGNNFDSSPFGQSIFEFGVPSRRSPINQSQNGNTKPKQHNGRSTSQNGMSSPFEQTVGGGTMGGGSIFDKAPVPVTSTASNIPIGVAPVGISVAPVGTNDEEGVNNISSGMLDKSAEHNNEIRAVVGSSVSPVGNEGGSLNGSLNGNLSGRSPSQEAEKAIFDLVDSS
jgi:hypothetical protein